MGWTNAGRHLCIFEHIHDAELRYFAEYTFGGAAHVLFEKENSKSKPSNENKPSLLISE